MNGEKFEVHPVYITENGEWIRGEIIEGKVQGVEELTLTEKATAKAISPTSLSTLSQEGEAVDVSHYFMDQMEKTVLYKEC